MPCQDKGQPGPVRCLRPTPVPGVWCGGQRGGCSLRKLRRGVERDLIGPTAFLGFYWRRIKEEKRLALGESFQRFSTLR